MFTEKRRLRKNQKLRFYETINYQRQISSVKLESESDIKISDNKTGKGK